MQEIDKVLQFVVKAHSGQFRKGIPLPYAFHPIEVCKQIARWDIANPVILKAALGHDLLEDTNITPKQLARAFGSQATFIIRELTFVPEVESDVSNKIQKQNYMKSFEEKSVPALVIKIADRICNTLDFLDDNRRYAEKYWNYATPLFDAFQTRKEEIDDFFETSNVFTMISYSRTKMNRKVS